VTSTYIILCLSVVCVFVLLMLYARLRKKAAKKKRKANIDALVMEINESMGGILSDIGLDKIRTVLTKYLG